MSRRLAPLLLALAACSEPSSVQVAPTDRFAWPASLAVTARDGGGSALLVASGNYDLTYDGADGGTVISVNPALAPDGSAGAAGGALVKYGAGANVGSYTGELVVVDEQTCPGAPAREAFVATRFADQLWRLPVGANGELGPCTTAGCAILVDQKLKDPFGLALACRADGARRSLFMSYLRIAEVDAATQAGFIAEVDLAHPSAPPRTIPLGGAPIAGMAYDEVLDQLYVLGQPLLAAPVYVLDLTPCAGGLATCARPAAASVDLFTAVPGVDPQAIVLSNRQDGLGRRAYVSARVYDAGLASLLQARPAADVTGLLLVLDVEPDLQGRPALKLVRAVETGIGPSQVRVLPKRALAGGVPRRDVVVVSTLSDGMLTVYDDEQGEVVRVVPVDPGTGAPELGRGAFGLAVEAQAGGVARVYVAASRSAFVSIVDVPLEAPGQAHVLRGADGAIVRIGGLQ